MAPRRRPGKPRAKSSRSRELDVFFGCLSEPNSLLEAIAASPSGKQVRLEGIDFEFGRISGLIPHLDATSGHWPFDFRPTYCCHLDNVSADRKRAIERAYRLTAGTISSKRSKADLLVVSESGDSHLISVKDVETTAKLGQVSREAKYGKVRLKGGTSGIDTLLKDVPKDLHHSDTALSKARFAKLGEKDRAYAYVKKQHRKAWELGVKREIDSAVATAESLSLELARDRLALIEFINDVFVGQDINHKTFYLLFGEQLIRYSDLLDALQSVDFEARNERYQTREKISFVVWITLRGTSYGLVKIEPAFDGASPKVEQTKGIIFYFQQFPNEGNHYKRLFQDLVS